MMEMLRGPELRRDMEPSFLSQFGIATHAPLRFPHETDIRLDANAFTSRARRVASEGEKSERGVEDSARTMLGHPSFPEQVERPAKVRCVTGLIARARATSSALRS